MDLKKNLSSIIIVPASLLVLLLAYWPAVLYHYFHHDDYLFWRISIQDWMMLNVAMGRLTDAGIIYLIKTGHTQHYFFNGLRLFTVFIWSLCAFRLFQWIRPYFSKTIDAFMVSCLVFTLPSYEIITSWASCSYISLAAYLAILAVHAADQAYQPRHQLSLSKLALVPVFLILSLLTYQTAAMLFWAMLAIRCFFKEYRKQFSWPKIFFLFGTGILSMAIYAIILNVGCKPYAVYLRSLYNPYALTVDYGAKLMWFIREPLYNTINLWNIFPNPLWVRITALIFLLTGVLAFLRSRQNQRKVFPIFFLLIILILLTYLPNILNKEPAPFYRTCLGLELILVFAWVWAIQTWIEILPSRIQALTLTILLMVMLGAGIQRCYSNIMLYGVTPNRMELNYVKNLLMTHDLNAYHRIVVISPAPQGAERYDEFGTFSSSFPQDIYGMLKCAILETGHPKTFDPNFHAYPVSFSNNEQQGNGTALIFNMRIPQRQYEQWIKSRGN